MSKSKLAGILIAAAIVGMSVGDALTGYGIKNNPNLNPLVVGDGSGSDGSGSGSSSGLRCSIEEVRDLIEQYDPVLEKWFLAYVIDNDICHFLRGDIKYCKWHYYTLHVPTGFETYSQGEAHCGSTLD